MAMEYHHQTNYKCYNDEMKENYYNEIFMRSYNSGNTNVSSSLYSPSYHSKGNGWDQTACTSALMTPPATHQTSWDNQAYSWGDHSCLPTPPLEAEQPCQKPMSKWKLKQERERLTLPQHVIKKRRLDANARERKRMTNLNNAFARLKAVLPPTNDNSLQTSTDKTLAEREMSKMETLRMAQAYILQLASMLH